MLSVFLPLEGFIGLKGPRGDIGELGEKVIIKYA